MTDSWAPPSEIELFELAVDQTLVLSGVSEALKSLNQDVAEIRTQFLLHRVSLMSPVREEVKEYRELREYAQQLREIIKKAVYPYWDFFSRDRPKTKPTIYSAIVQPILSTVALGPMGARFRNIVVRWITIAAYYAAALAILFVPLTLALVGYISLFLGLIVPSFVAAFAVISVLAVVQLALAPSVPSATKIFNQRIELNAKLDELVENDEDYLLAVERLTELALNIERKLVDSALLPALKLQLNNTSFANGALADPNIFAILGSHGLGEIHQDNFTISSGTTTRLLELLRQLPGGSIGLAGPRGIGKSTSLRQITGPDLNIWPEPTLALYLSAPVHYATADFIAYLAAELCQTILGAGATDPPAEAETVAMTRVSDRRELTRQLKRQLRQLFSLITIPAAVITCYLGVLWTLHSALTSVAVWVLLLGGCAISAVAFVVSRMAGFFAGRRARLIRADDGDVWLLAIALIAPFVYGCKQYTPIHSPAFLAWIAAALLFACLAIVLGQQAARRPKRAFLDLADLLARQKPRAAPGSPFSGLAPDAERLRRSLIYTTSSSSKISSKWSGGMSAIRVQLQSEVADESSYAEERHVLSLPEVVSAVRTLIQKVAVSGRALIVIDEMDKIDDEGEARQFINDLKSIFGLYRSYYVLSVSEDALTSFDRRSLAVRTEYDSAFDEIIYAPYLTFDETLELLDRRTTGLTKPFARLAYCLSGGIPRDAIRSLRTIIDSGTRLTSSVGSAPLITLVADDVIRRDLARYAAAWLTKLPGELPTTFLVSLAKLRDLETPAAELEPMVLEVNQSSPTEDAKAPPESLEIVTLLTFYAEVWRSVCSESTDESSIERLARARRELSKNIIFASYLISSGC